jgi:histidyl-tRNA synthetase
MFRRVKGTQDLLDLTLLNFLVDRARKHFNKYNFTQIETPILEHTKLFQRSLGLETDIVTKEMFIVKTSKDEESICLRPEATASVVRAFIENGIQVVPWKVFAYGSMFRHERPQKGRYRQFHQISLEIIGSNDIAQDAFFIKMLDRFFTEDLFLNSYGLLINFLGCSKDRAKFKEELKKFLDKAENKICKTCLERKEKNIMRVFDCKNEECQKIYADAPRIVDRLCKECDSDWQKLKETLEVLSVTYSYAPNLVRGLDYYNKTVFEFVSPNLGSQGTLCGGGRYDQLATELGAKEDYPSIGAAMGVERVLLLLDQIKDKLPLAQSAELQIIIPMKEEQKLMALLIADQLIINGLTVEVLLEDASMKSKMRKANKLGAKNVLIIGSEEQATQEVTIKNMLTGQEDKILQVNLIEFLKK